MNLATDQLSGVCCAYCLRFETSRCPIKTAEPWSRWQNWCNAYEPDTDLEEAKSIIEAMSET